MRRFVEAMSTLRLALWAWPRVLLLHINLIYVPQSVGSENSRLKVFYVVLRGSQNIRACQANHWNVLSDDFLHAVVDLLALCIIESHKLLLHQAVDLRLPRRRGVFFFRVPQM